MDTYKVEDSGKHVTLLVKIGSSGTTETRVYLDIMDSDHKVCESEGDSGDIPITKVGINRKLFLRTLIINTSLNLAHIPPSEVDDAIKMTHITYLLKGGPEGDKFLDRRDAEVNDSDLSSVEITKRIEFV